MAIHDIRFELRGVLWQLVPVGAALGSVEACATEPVEANRVVIFGLDTDGSRLAAARALEPHGFHAFPVYLCHIQVLYRKFLHVRFRSYSKLRFPLFPPSCRLFFHRCTPGGDRSVGSFYLNLAFNLIEPGVQQAAL